MRFSLNTYLTDYNNFTYDQIKSKIIYEARRYIIWAPMKASELTLNKYLVKEMGKSLKSICLSIIYNCNITVNKEKELTITFKTKEINRLAELVTFGTGKIPGCKILVTAFNVLRK